MNVDKMISLTRIFTPKNRPCIQCGKQTPYRWCKNCYTNRIKKVQLQMKKGVPTGYKHNWSYKGHWYEKKIAPGKWKVIFKATKKTKSGRGGPKPGFKIHWGFKNVQQKAVKTGKGKYQTILTGIKYTKGVNNKKRRKWR